MSVATNGKTPVDLLVKNGYVITIDKDRNVFTNGFVAVKDKKILATGPMSSCTYAGSQEIDAKGGVIMPGLVNSHAHLVQTCIKGMAEGTEFMERFLGFYLPMTGLEDEKASYDNVRMTLLEYVKGGITTTSDDHFTNVNKDSIDGVIRAINEGGMRGHVTRLSDNNAEVVPEKYRENPSDGIKEVQRLQKAYTSDSIRVGAGTIGIGYVTTERDLLELKEFSEATKTTCDIHCASSRDNSMLPGRGWKDDSFSYLDHIGFWTKYTLMCHSQRVKEPQLQRMKEIGVRVTLCPTQGAGLQFKDYLKHDIKFGLGIDGPVVSYHQNLWQSIRGFLNSQRSVESLTARASGQPAADTWSDADYPPDIYRYPRPSEAVRMGGPLFGTPEMALEKGTLGSAQALAWEDKIGTLDAGKWADLIILDPNYPGINPRGRLVTLLVFAGAPDMVDTVIIGGKVVVRGKKHQIWDEAEVVAKANEQQRRLAKEAGTERFMPLKGSRWHYV